MIRVLRKALKEFREQEGAHYVPFGFLDLHVCEITKLQSAPNGDGIFKRMRTKARIAFLGGISWLPISTSSSSDRWPHQFWFSIVSLPLRLAKGCTQLQLGCTKLWGRYDTP